MASDVKRYVCYTEREHAGGAYVRYSDYAALEARLKALENSINHRLNDRLVEMKPEWDDSITGFNEAWDIVREVFKRNDGAGGK
jgi:hypothetical protein